MFVIKTQERQADPRQDVEHRVMVFRDDTLHVIAPWNEDNSEAWNHANAALESLKKSSGIPDFTPHHLLGAAAVPGEDFWVVVVQEGE